MADNIKGYDGTNKFLEHLVSIEYRSEGIVIITGFNQRYIILREFSTKLMHPIRESYAHIKQSAYMQLKSFLMGQPDEAPDAITKDIADYFTGKKARLSHLAIEGLTDYDLFPEGMFPHWKPKTKG